MTHRTYNVLFLCTGNSARSIMAESILNRVGAGRLKAFSAGSRPKGRVHPLALEVLERFGVTPDKVVEVQALAGDSTDNVPGVPGIGVKTAAQLITEYGDLETLLANTEKINAALANIESQRQGIMAEAQAQSARLIAEARDIAKRLQEQEAQRSIATAEQIMAKAREAAEQEHARMLAELRREVGRLVVQTTTAVVGKVLTPDDERRLAEETARHLAAN